MTSPISNDSTELHVSSGISSSCTKRIIVESMLSDANNASTTKQRNEIKSPARRSIHIVDSDTTSSSSTGLSTEGVSDPVHVVVNVEKFDMSKDPNRTQPHPPINTPTARVNRFAQWAFKSQVGGSDENDTSKNTSRSTEQLVQLQQSMSMPEVNTGIAGNGTVIGQKRPRPTAGTTATSIGSKHKKEFVPMKDLSELERQSEIDKWHSVTSLFTPPDINFAVSIEDRRFHMVLATILHTRCQEPSVRAAIIQLVNYFERNDVPLTVQSMVDLNRNHNRNVPCDLVPLIKNLQYHNTKVKYMTQASQYICDHFNGIVPHNEKELLQLPGIGPLFSDLLSTINTNKLHEQYLEQERRCEQRIDNTNGGNANEHD